MTASLALRQLDRLSPGEREILDWLAIRGEPVSVKQLAAEIVLPDSGQLLDSLSLLRGRSLIETVGDRFTVQPVVSEYLTDKFFSSSENRAVISSQVECP